MLLLTLRIDTGIDRPPFMDRVSVGGPYKPQQLAGADLLVIDRSWCVTDTGFDRMRSEVRSFQLTPGASADGLALDALRQRPVPSRIAGKMQSAP